MSAAIAVWKWNRAASSVTRWIVRCVSRARAACPRGPSSPPERGGDALAEVVDAVQEPVGAGHPLLGPLRLLLRRADEERVDAHRVGAEAGDQLVRRDRVAPRLRHLLDLARRGIQPRDHALVEEALERLLEMRRGPCPSGRGRRSGRRAGAGSRARCRRCTGRPASSAATRSVSTICVCVVRDSGTAGSTRRSPRTCPWCRSRGARGRRTSGTSSRTKASDFSSGLPSAPRNSTSSGRRTGRSSSGTGTTPQAGQWIAGNRRAPVALARDQPVAQAVADLASSRRPSPRASGSPRGPPRGRSGVPSQSPERHSTPPCGMRLGHRRRIELARPPCGRRDEPGVRTCARTRSRAGRAPARP